MNKPRLYVDFNEMIDSDLGLLSKTDYKLDSAGNEILLFEGLIVHIYSDDVDDHDKIDNLVASGIVELNKHGGWASVCKWNCRIDSHGIRNQSDLLEKED